MGRIKFAHLKKFINVGKMKVVWQKILWVLTYYIFPFGLVGLGVIMLIRLAIVYEADRPEFWQMAGLLIGSFAVIFAGIAAGLASRSLELTRNTVRPFLTTVNEPDEPMVIGEKDNPRVILHIKNTGNLPADKISVLCVLYTTNKDYGIIVKHVKTALAPPVYFPGVVVGHTFCLDKEQFQECQKGRFTVRILIKYDNRIAKKPCSTQRSFIYEALTTTPQTPINVTHRDDWWD